jgi:prophage regulatory protein
MNHPETIQAEDRLIHSELNTLLEEIRGAAFRPARQQLIIGPPADHAMLRPAAASAYLGISRTTLHRLSEQDPTFPRKIVLSPRCVGYTPKSLTNWLAAKVSQP